MEKSHVTKRQLGLIFIALGVVGAAASFGRDLLGSTDFAGIGPLQQVTLAVAAASILLGLSLLPLGDRPA